MKNLKTLLSLLLVVVFCVTLLAACAPAANTPADAENSGETPADTTNEPVDSEEPDADEPSDSEEPEFEDEEIVIYMMFTNAKDDIASVQSAINEISSERYGITVKLNGYGMGDYSTQLSLAISGGETVDLACMTPISGANFASITSAGQAMDISGLIETYCPAVMAEMGDYINAFRIGDAVYGLPVARQKSSNVFYRYRSDLAEELGLVDTINNAKSFDDLTEVFQQVKDGSDVYPLGGSRTLNGRANAFWHQNELAITSFDTVGDNLYLIYGGDDGKAHFLYENEDYLFMCKQLAAWNDAGFVWGDTFTNTEQTATQLIDGGICFGEFVATEVGQDIDGYSGGAANYPVNYRKLGAGLVSTSAVNVWANFVPATSKSPEAALAFVNALYTDAELMNLLIFGIEGKNYVVNENGEACYPEGMNPETCGYHNMDWMMGNSFIMYPWEGQGANFREIAREDLENSVVSPFMGFSLDTSNLSDKIAALSAVYDEYGEGMISGLYSDENLESFKSKLDAAGLNEYIAEIQNQIDNWAK